MTRILAGSAAGQGLVILAYPLLSRIYDPADFGLLIVFSAVVSMAGVLSTASLEAAVPLPVDDRDAAAVAWAAVASVVLTAALTAVVGVLAGPWIADLLGVPALAGFWWLVALTVLVLGSYLVFSEWMVRERSYGALGRRNLLQGVGQVCTQLGLGAAGVRPVGLLLGLGAGRLLGIGGLVSRAGLLHQPRPSLAAMKSIVGRYRRFPLVASWSKLLNTAGLEAPLLIISAVYGDARAGLLGLTIRVIGGPAAIIGQAVYQVFNGEASARVRAPGTVLAPFVRGSVLRLLAIGVVPATVLVAFGPGLFAVVFGAQWREAGQFAQVLAVAYLAQFAIAPVSQTLFLLERQGLQLVWDSSRLVLTAGGPVVCGLVGASISTAVLVLAIGHVACYGLLYVLCIRAAQTSDRAGDKRDR
ncbi:lipopolysaccharide biosynthesis protein [Pseudonocardia sp. H11422]|uniref:lipopolysaccharide biosynthesis protein n=1 Tax=Pseudonocardia sp. H11422 TaxID=2835866 RepID=UPI001BDBB74C|nr:oligosaccharide flippase family protein [Pseudonocardia sp. H11422]